MIGIVGNGFVGNAVYQNFRDKTPCKVYDTDKNRSLNTLSEVIEQNLDQVNFQKNHQVLKDHIHHHSS